MAFVALGLSLAWGCSSDRSGDGPSVQATTELQEVGDLLRIGGARRPPAKLTDLSAGRSAHPQSYEMVQSGKIVVVWGIPMASEGDIESGTAPKAVIAYEKETPTAGGRVLLQNGAVEEMTADQFKAVATTR
ncbi:hypothetical protein [Caulifigura coniformis]|uniref:hypothetical protein n=1 Tax=Caulifigura coniformis TaxID=2527983 RepID=UPI00119C9778|nr:hypothetical protein [Caulifigura coniformis]